MKSTPQSRLVTVAAMAGIIGPILFAIIVIVLGAVRSGYDSLTQGVSVLGATNAPNMSIQALNFAILGILTIVFAIGLTLHKRRFQSTSVFVGIYGLGTLLLAVLPCGPGCSNGSSSVQLAHDLVTLTSFVAIAVAPLILWRSSKTLPAWTKTALWSLRIAIGSIPLLGAYLIIIVLSLSPYAGLLQRVFLGLLFVWMIIIAAHLFSSQRTLNFSN